MKNIALNGSLLAGISYVFDTGIEIINYKLEDIYEKIRIDKYFEILNILHFDKDKFMQKGYSEHEVDYYMMCITIDFLETFIVCDNVKYNNQCGDYMVYVTEDEFVWVDNVKLKRIFKVIKTMYCICDKKDEIHDDDIEYANDDVAKRFKEFFEAEKNMKHETKDMVTLESIIEYVSVKHPSINLINVWELTMWQLHRTYLRLSLVDNQERTLDGIYAGTVDGKKINLEKLRADKSLD